MRHQQILTKLAAAGHVRALDEDLARCVGLQMHYHSGDELAAAVIPSILTRWRCLLDADDAAAVTKNVVRVALATLLHKYGLRDDAVTASALIAIDDLNRDVALSDAFERQSPAIKAFLGSPAVPLTRRPRQPKSTTFLRVGDVVSIELDGLFHVAYVQQLHGLNEYPIIEFFADRFHRLPEVAQVSGGAAARPNGRARFGVDGLTYLPDPARQVVALASSHPHPPQGGEPGPGHGLYTVSDIISLQRHLAGVFPDGP